MREKLIELLRNAKAAMKAENLSCDIAKNMFVVEFMMANGVTVQQWIPVSERLPADDIPSKMYLCFWNGMIRVCKYWRTQKCFNLRGKDVKVTHWMPLPEPPKEE